MSNTIGETIYSFSTEPPQPAERRRETRYLTILRVGALVVDGRRELCLIRNISAGGLKAHVYSELRVGQRLSIELKSNQLVDGRVSWVKDSNIGVAFDEVVEVEEVLATPKTLHNGWTPRLPRVEVDSLGTLRVGSHVYPVTTVDISQGGVKVEIDNQLEVGENVVLAFDGFRPVSGVVRWCHEGACGISFNQVLPFHELMGWIRRH